MVWYGTSASFGVFLGQFSTESLFTFGTILYGRLYEMVLLKRFCNRRHEVAKVRSCLYCPNRTKVLAIGLFVLSHRAQQLRTETGYMSDMLKRIPVTYTQPTCSSGKVYHRVPYSSNDRQVLIPASPRRVLKLLFATTRMPSFVERASTSLAYQFHLAFFQQPKLTILPAAAEERLTILTRSTTIF